MTDPARIVITHRPPPRCRACDLPFRRGYTESIKVWRERKYCSPECTQAAQRDERAAKRAP